MALLRWLGQDDFIRRMERWQRDLERRLTAESSRVGFSPSVYPPINIYDDGEAFIARAEIPGVNPANLDITVTGDTLTLRGKREIEVADENCCYHRRERRAGEFRRAFTLPDQVDSSKVVARSTNGVLEIMLPRAEQAKQRKVQVESS